MSSTMSVQPIEARDTTRIGLEGAADNGDVGIGRETRRKDPDPKVRAEGAAGASSKLSQQGRSDGEREGGVARRAAGHSVDLAVEKFVLHVARALEVEILSERVAV
jgi:hypothetical protein